MYTICYILQCLVYSLGWPGTHCVKETDLRFRDILLSLPLNVGMKSHVPPCLVRKVFFFKVRFV